MVDAGATAQAALAAAAEAHAHAVAASNMMEQQHLHSTVPDGEYMGPELVAMDGESVFSEGYTFPFGTQLEDAEEELKVAALRTGFVLIRQGHRKDANNATYKRIMVCRHAGQYRPSRLLAGSPRARKTYTVKLGQCPFRINLVRSRRSNAVEPGAPWRIAKLVNRHAGHDLRPNPRQPPVHEKLPTTEVLPVTSRSVRNPGKVTGDDLTLPAALQAHTPEQQSQEQQQEQQSMDQAISSAARQSAVMGAPNAATAAADVAMAAATEEARSMIDRTARRERFDRLMAGFRHVASLAQYNENAFHMVVASLHDLTNNVESMVDPELLSQTRRSKGRPRASATSSGYSCSYCGKSGH